MSGVVNVVTEEGGGPFHGQLFAEGGEPGLRTRPRAILRLGGRGRAPDLQRGRLAPQLVRGRRRQTTPRARPTRRGARSCACRRPPRSRRASTPPTLSRSSTKTRRPSAPSPRPASSRRARSRATSCAATNRARPRPAQPRGRDLPARGERPGLLARRRASSPARSPSRSDPPKSFGYSVTYHGLVTRNSFREGPAVPGDPADFFFEPQGSTVNDFDGSVHTLDARADFRLGRHNFVNAGYEFERENFFTRFLDVTPSGNSSADVAERSHSFFVQDQLRFLDDRLQLSAAFRAQTFRLGDADLHALVGRALRGAHVRLAAQRLHGRRLDRLPLPLDGHEAARRTSATATASRRSTSASAPSTAASSATARSATRGSRPSARSPLTPESTRRSPRTASACRRPTSTRGCKRSSGSATRPPTRSGASAASSTPAAGSRAAWS